MGNNSAVPATALSALEPREGRYLVARVEERIRIPAAIVGLDLPVLGVTPAPNGSEVIEVDGTPWLLADPFDDPLTRSTNGRQVIPSDARERLIRLVQAGVEPDVLHIAHELPEGTALEDVPKLPPPASPELAAADAVLAERLKQAVRVAVMGVGAAALAPLALVAALGDLDPVLLGGIEGRTGEHVAWVELARWTA